MNQLALALALVLAPLALAAYAYVGYPVLLRVVAGFRPRRSVPTTTEWPSISISLPVFNEEAQIRGVLDRLLELDYPADRRQILVISDACTDGTEAIVREYAGRGVELLRLDRRNGKTAAENAARPHLRGEIVVNTDASIRIHPAALKPLLAAFADPRVGVASGRDVSVARGEADANVGESGYVGYEMGVRALETRVGGIVGSSGCFYAIRARLHGAPLPERLSRDFASALTAREHGFRAVSVDEAVCFVPRTESLHREYRRKVRTMTRGMQTLFHKRHLLNPLRHPLFAWMLWSHKVARWAVPWTVAAAAAGLCLLAATEPWARWLLAAGVAGAALGVVGWTRAERHPLPRWLALPTYALAGNVAALHAGWKALRGEDHAVWEPTRRDLVPAQQR